jgi:EcsC protein family
VPVRSSLRLLGSFELSLQEITEITTEDREALLNAARFGVVVSQKVAAQALPVVGALGGAAVNYAFIEHFQDIARGHFTVRRLERIYCKERIRAEYDAIAADLSPP